MKLLKFLFFICLFVCLTVGCQLCMGHAVDKDLLSLVQTEVKRIIKDLTMLSAQLFQAQKTAVVLQVRLDKRDARLDAVEENLQEDEDTRREEMKILAAIEKIFSEELLKRVQGVEESLAVMNTEVKELRFGATNTDSKVGHLEQGLAEASGKVEQLQDGLSNTGSQVEKL